jgi:hypothetical protein
VGEGGERGRVWGEREREGREGQTWNYYFFRWTFILFWTGVVFLNWVYFIFELAFSPR